MSTPNETRSTDDTNQLEIDLSSLVFGSDDALFGCIEHSQIKFKSGDFGSFLDAGTGSHSLRWIASLIHRTHGHSSLQTRLKNNENACTISDYTAVTADGTMQRNVIQEAKKLGIESYGKVVIGNWCDGINPSISSSSSLCQGEMYDTILADYLVGAIDGFSPYFQDLIFSRLVRHLKPGGRIYVVGLDPIPDKVDGDANIFCKVTKLRDACILVAGTCD